MVAAPPTPAGAGQANGQAPQTRPLRVLELVGNGIVGGMETWVLRLAERLPRSRFELQALCAFEGEFTRRLRALGVPCQVTPMPESPGWAALQATCAMVQHQQIDVLHAHLPNAHALAGLVGRLTGRPVVATLHGRQMSMMDLEVQRLAATHISTVCRHSYHQALGAGVAPDRVGCIPNGVCTRQFRPADATARRAGRLRALFARPERPALPPELPLVGFVGRLSPEKGPEVFVRAALLLHQRLPHLHFVMVGDGPQRAQIEALVSQCGLAEHLRISGVLDDMAPAYQELDVMVSTSHSEAMPLAVMEAMASGLPVVGTWVGGVPELVEHGRTGWMVSPGNFEGTAQQVALLIEHPDQARQMGALARERAVACFDLDTHIGEVGEMLSGLASSPGEPGRALSLRDAFAPGTTRSPAHPVVC